MKTDDKKVHAAPPEFMHRTRELLAGPHPQAPQGFPFQLANRRNRHSMNSWLNELPGLHPSGKRNEVVIHPEDAVSLGIGEGDRVRVFSAIGIGITAPAAFGSSRLMPIVCGTSLGYSISRMCGCPGLLSGKG